MPTFANFLDPEVTDIKKWKKSKMIDHVRIKKNIKGGPGGKSK